MSNNTIIQRIYAKLNDDVTIMEAMVDVMGDEGIDEIDIAAAVKSDKTLLNNLKEECAARRLIQEKVTKKQSLDTLFGE